MDTVRHDDIPQDDSDPRTRIVGLQRRVAAAQHDLLVELAAFDRTGGWKADGAADGVAWVTHHLGVSRPTARQWLEVAHRLDHFPLLASHFRNGHLTVDQMRPLCRLAAGDTGSPAAPVTDSAPSPSDPGAPAAADLPTETDLVEYGEFHTVAELDRLARRTRPVTRRQETDDVEAGTLETWWDERHRFLHLNGRVAGVDGAVVELALRRLATQAPKDPDTGEWRDYDLRMSEALVQMASESMRRDGDPDRATVVVHVDASTLAGDGHGFIPDGPTLTAETLRQLTCDGRWVCVLSNGDGCTIGVGRTTRTIPPWLARLVTARDQGCRFPGCRRSRWTQIHHIIHWAKGGRTDLHNLVTLCGYHHRMLHREGWRIEGSPAGDLTWIRPDGDRHRPLRLTDSTAAPPKRGLRVPPGSDMSLAWRLEGLNAAFTTDWGPPPGPVLAVSAGTAPTRKALVRTE